MIESILIIILVPTKNIMTPLGMLRPQNNDNKLTNKSTITSEKIKSKIKKRACHL